MANREACELYIEQEIKDSLEQGKKPYSIGKELSVWIQKLFETYVKPDTIKKRAERLQNKLGTNVPKNSQPPETITNFQSDPPEILKDRLPQGGGAREGAGRPKYIHTETHEVSNAIRIASIVVSQLERIKNDPKKEEAFEIIIKWIAANREEL